MFSFVGLFAIAWIWPALASLWNYIAPGTLPLPLHYLDVAAVSGSGFFNFFSMVYTSCLQLPDMFMFY